FVEKTLQTFNQMQLAGVKPDSTTFASILPVCAKMGTLQQGYAQNGLFEKTLDSFKQMQLAGVEPDSTTFASILPACAKMGALEHGMYIHQSIIESEFLSDVAVANALIDMYGKCGSIDKARKMFDKTPRRDVISWTAMIAGYTQNGVLGEAMRLFKEIPQPDIVSWNAMVKGYSQNGFVEEALETFKQMQLAGLKPNSTTFISILPACAKTGALKQGINIHQNIIISGFSSDVVVASALADMYAKCGSIEKAHELFNKMRQRNLISWNTMIAGYAQNRFVEKTLQTFNQMQLAGVKPDSTTFASILPVCAKMRALQQGMDIHQSIVENGLLSDVVVVSALVDMYAKCGRTQKAHQLFDKMPQRDVVSWSTMIAGY
ncbi:hypothetical protein KI387_032202, partial [Taxus chinensis]